MGLRPSIVLYIRPKKGWLSLIWQLTFVGRLWHLSLEIMVMLWHLSLAVTFVEAMLWHFVVGCDICRGLLWHLSRALTFSGIVTFVGTTGGGPRVVVSTAAFHARVRGSVPGLGGLEENKNKIISHPRVKVSIVGSHRDREVACSASDRQVSYFESCVWRTVSSQSSHHPEEVLLAQFSRYVHKGGLKPDSFHFVRM